MDGLAGAAKPVTADEVLEAADVFGPASQEYEIHTARPRPSLDDQGSDLPPDLPAVIVDLYDHEESVGLYVYSYPMYLAAPISSVDGRTLYKLATEPESGAAPAVHPSEDFIEDLVLLRVFPTLSPELFKPRFHNILKAAGHFHEDSQGAACWYLTSLELIDAIAEAFDLNTDLLA